MKFAEVMLFFAYDNNSKIPNIPKIYCFTQYIVREPHPYFTLFFVNFSLCCCCAYKLMSFTKYLFDKFFFSTKFYKFCTTVEDFQFWGV